MSGNKRKRADNERNSGSLKKFKAGIADLELLNCEICFELPKGEVYQCPKGHSVCSKCIVNLKKCPTCDVPYPAADGQGTGKIRNYFAEKILSTVRFHCPWREQGCDKEGLTGQQVTKHEEQCSFNPNPIKLCCLLFSNTCGYEVSREFLRNPALDIPGNLQEHFRATHLSLYPQIMQTILSGSITVEKYSSSSMNMLFNDEFTYMFRDFIRLLDNSSKRPLGLYMVWRYNYELQSEVKQMSWFLVRVTDQPKSCSVRVKFTLKSTTMVEDNGASNCETSWYGQILGLHEFAEFQNTPLATRDKFKVAIPLSLLQDQYLNADGGLDLHFVFTVTPHADQETAGR